MLCGGGLGKRVVIGGMRHPISNGTSTKDSAVSVLGGTRRPGGTSPSDGTSEANTLDDMPSTYSENSGSEICVAFVQTFDELLAHAPVCPLYLVPTL